MSASFPGRNGAIVYGQSTGDRNTAFFTSIEAMNPRTRRVRVLRSCPRRMNRPFPDCALWSPHYSPDGRRIAFLTSYYAQPGTPGTQTQPGVGTMAPNGSGFEHRPTANQYSRLAWSPEGDRFLMERFFRPASGTDPFAMYITSLEGREIAQVTPGSSRGPASPQPDWSSRGEIAFVVVATGCTHSCRENIFIRRVGAIPRRLTSRGGTSPSWSPRGAKVAFVRRVSSTQSDVFIIRRTGRGLRRLTYRGGLTPTWSPDGKWIAFVRGRDLHVIRADGKRRRLLVRDVAKPDGPDATEAADWQPLP